MQLFNETQKEGGSSNGPAIPANAGPIKLQGIHLQILVIFPTLSFEFCPFRSIACNFSPGRAAELLILLGGVCAGCFGSGGANRAAVPGQRLE
jgi:hypothetical protein